MSVIDARTGLERLSPPECWRLLSDAAVGRIGVIADGAPEIYPMNFVVDGSTIVLRTDRGIKFRALLRHPSVCFEVDGVDLEARTGWSVLVKGRADEVRDASEVRRVSGLPMPVWAPGSKESWIRIRPVEITGRLLRPTAPQSP